MASSDHLDSFNTNGTPIRFEGLEERLLLTTLHGGDFFIYQNSQGENVRIQVNGDPSDTIELLSLWDVDLDGYPEWWQPGPYDETTYPAQQWDCDDRDPLVRPGAGCS